LSHFKIILLLIGLVFSFLTEAQTLHFRLISSLQEYNNLVQENNNMRMVEISGLIPSAKIDLRYATKNNFTGKRMYPVHTKNTFLRAPVAKALADAADELRSMNLGFLIWDAYRPFHVTVKFWELIHDERYVANPAKGSGHNRGIAVDLTLYDLSTGKEIKMPTSFDDFSEAAHHGQQIGDMEKTNNRELLRSIMEKHGFLKFETEWWHYYWPGGEKFDVMDIPFEKLQKSTNDTKR
jgi:D-alanyl-D-alanine dipeptidase